MKVLVSNVEIMNVNANVVLILITIVVVKINKYDEFLKEKKKYLFTLVKSTELVLHAVCDPTKNWQIAEDSSTTCDPKCNRTICQMKYKIEDSTCGTIKTEKKPE